MATFVSDQILGKPVQVSATRITRTGWKIISAGEPYPLLQVSDFSVSPTNRDTTETSVFGDVKTGGATKTDVGDLGTTELALSGPVAHGSKGIELFRDSALNEKDLYLEYGVRGQVVNSWDELDGDASDVITMKIEDATAPYGSRKKISFSATFQSNASGKAFIEDIVAGYTIAYKADATATVNAAHMWNVDTISEIANPEIIVSRLPGSSSDLVDVGALPPTSGDTEGTIYLVRPHVFRQFRVRALAIPGESQTGAANLGGTYNFSLQEELDTTYLMPYDADFNEFDVASSTGIDS